MFGRRGVPTREVSVGGMKIGGLSPVSIQGMTKCDSRNARAVLDEIAGLEAAGCELVRVAVPDAEAVEALRVVTRESPLPVIADVHFDYRLAVGALAAGVHKIRINPGNIGGRERVVAVAREAAGRGVPLRVGVNSGSIERDILRAKGGPSAEAMVESAVRQASILEEMGFRDIVISLKSSRVPVMIEAYRLAARVLPYPLHLGVTETGAGSPGVVKSAAGIAPLLADGIGDTIRVSLTGPSTDEISIGLDILAAVGLRRARPEIISCPTCGRCTSDLVAIVADVKRRLRPLQPAITIAIMGCEVNGPGEAREADLGIAMGNGRGAIFAGGRVVKTVADDRVVDELVEMVQGLARDHVEREERTGRVGGGASGARCGDNPRV